MSVTCFIRHQIHPFQRDAFRAHAEAWGRVIVEDMLGMRDQARKVAP